jgi:hypothetical protein
MRGLCYQDVEQYRGIDRRRVHQPDTLVGNNEVLAPPMADDFDLFDCDAYGNPWRLCDLIAARRTNTDPFVFVATCAQLLRMRYGRASSYVQQKLGLPPQRSRSSDQKQARKHRKGFCDVCGSTDALEAHHIDHDMRNLSPSNVMTLCRACHHRQHRLESRSELPGLFCWYDTFIRRIFTDWPVSVLRCTRARSRSRHGSGAVLPWLYVVLCEKR